MADPPAHRIMSLEDQAFVAAFVENGFNASAAYRTAYKPGPEMSVGHVGSAAARIKNKPAVRRAIDDVVEKTRNPVVFTQQDALQAWLDIARADPNELIALRVGCCRYCYGEGGRYQWRLLEYEESLDNAEAQAKALAGTAKAADVKFPDPAGGFGYDATLPPVRRCHQCHGEGLQRVVAQDTTDLSPDARLLYGGVKQTRNGVEIIIADRVKALENACRIIGAFDDKMRFSGQLAVMQAAITLTTTDPNEAQRAYEAMIRNHIAA